jgi:hypothetical protein
MIEGTPARGHTARLYEKHNILNLQGLCMRALVVLVGRRVSLGRKALTTKAYAGRSGNKTIVVPGWKKEHSRY